MRLAIVSQQGRKASGAEHALLEFVSRLPEAIDVHWFFLEDGEFAQEIRRDYRSVTVVKMSDRVANAQRSGMDVTAVVDSASVMLRLSRALRRARPQIVLTNSMKAHIVGSLAAKIAGLPCVNYIHDMVDGPALALLRLVSRLCATERMTCSSLVRSHLRLPKTTVAYAAIDVATFAQLPPQRTSREKLGLPLGDVPIVGLVGRIARWKGQDRFIRIAAIVRKRQDVHFCIVGSPIFGCDSDYVDELHAEIERLGLRGHVTFVPWQNDMRAVYSAIDVACNCSDREPFGRTSLEALASGVPIVCFDDAGVCEIFSQHQGGLSVGAGDEDAFAAAISGLVVTPEALANAGAGARLTAQGTDIDRIYGVFTAVLERVARVTSGVCERPKRQLAASELPLPAQHHERQVENVF